MTPAAFRAALEATAAAAPDRPALEGGATSLAWRDLPPSIDRARASLRASGATSVALAAADGPAWMTADLACLLEGIPLTPLPPFFTEAQVRHAVAASGADLVLGGGPAAEAATATGAGPDIAGGIAGLRARRIPGRGRAALPTGTAKVTFTSGTTGEPKGACLPAEAMLAVAASTVRRTGAGPGDRHVATLPLAVLLENVAGAYRILLAGGTFVAPDPRETGLAGSSALDAERLAACLRDRRATSAIGMPAMLEGLVAAVEARPSLLAPTLRFLGVGGARTPPSLLHRAAGAGIPALEGYGLSECASVVCLSAAGDARPGAVGRPLAHASVRLAADGEVLVSGATFLGYAGLGGGPGRDGAWATGDLGSLDGDGRLVLRGRKRLAFATSFGRKISPEWVEGALADAGGVAAAAVFGEGLAGPVALVVPVDGAPAALDAVRRANATLPDYARVRAAAVVPPFAASAGLATPSGRLRRDRILAAHASLLASLAGRPAEGLLPSADALPPAAPSEVPCPSTTN